MAFARERACERMRELLPAARKLGAAHGSLHPVWDAVLDAEAFCDGRQTLLQGTDEYRAAEILKSLEGYGLAEGERWVAR